MPVRPLLAPVIWHGSRTAGRLTRWAIKLAANATTRTSRA